MNTSFITRTFAAVAATAIAASLAVAPATAAPKPTPKDPRGVPQKTSPKGLPDHGRGPIQYTFPTASLYSNLKPGSVPLGANDFECKPVKGKNPIVLVPGTNEDAYTTWAYYSPMLKKLGRCIYTFNYNPIRVGFYTHESTTLVGDIRQSAAFMSQFVDRVLASTGAQKVDLIGHSQGGGALPNAYIKWYGGKDKVSKLIGLAPSVRGTTGFGLVPIADVLKLRPAAEAVFEAINATAFSQQLAGSRFVKALHKGGYAVPGIEYTHIGTMLDDVLTPYHSVFVHQRGVRNILIQKICPMDLTDHFGFTYDPVAYQVVQNVLTGKKRPVNCHLVPPFFQ